MRTAAKSALMLRRRPRSLADPVHVALQQTLQLQRNDARVAHQHPGETRKPDGTDSIQPRMPTYHGKVYVLIGAANSSATFEFAEQVKASGLATLVGQTTGGNRRGINGGAFFFLTLPNSGVELDVPLVGQFPITAQPDAGTEPDLSVNITPEDVASGRDNELEAVLALKSGPRK